MFKKKKSRKNLTIYTVDDSFFVRKSIYEYLYKKPQNMDFFLSFDFVGEACLKRELMDQLPQIQADVFFLDMDLPDGTAWDLVPTIHLYLPQAIIIAMTDEKTIETQQLRTQYEDQVLTILEKPFQPSHLFEAIELAARQRFEIKEEEILPQQTPTTSERTRISFEPEEMMQEFENIQISHSLEASDEWELESSITPSTQMDPNQSFAMNFNLHLDEQEEVSPIVKPSHSAIGLVAKEENLFVDEIPLKDLSDEATTCWSFDALDELINEPNLPESKDTLPSIQLDPSSLECFNEEVSAKVEIETISLQDDVKSGYLSSQVESQDFILSEDVFEPFKIEPSTPTSPNVVHHANHQSSFLIEDVYEDDEFGQPSNIQEKPVTCIISPSHQSNSQEENLLHLDDNTSKNEENDEKNLLNTFFLDDFEEKKPYFEEFEEFDKKNEDEIQYFNFDSSSKSSLEEKNPYLEEEKLLSKKLDFCESEPIIPSNESEIFFDFTQQVDKILPNSSSDVPQDELTKTDAWQFDLSETLSKPQVDLAKPTLNSEWDLGLNLDFQKHDDDSSFHQTSETLVSNNEYFLEEGFYTETSQCQNETDFYLIESTETLSVSNISQTLECSTSECSLPSQPQESISFESVQTKTLTSQEAPAELKSTEFTISPPRSKGLPGVPSNPKEFGRFGIRK